MRESLGDEDRLRFPLDLEGRFILLTSDAVRLSHTQRVEIRNWLMKTLIGMDVPYAQAQSSGGLDSIATTILWELCNRYRLSFVTCQWSCIERESDDSMSPLVRRSLVELERHPILCTLEGGLCDGVTCEFERGTPRMWTVVGDTIEGDEIPVELTCLAARSLQRDGAVSLRAYLSALYLREVAFIVDEAPAGVNKEGKGPPGDWTPRLVNLVRWTRRVVSPT